MPFTIRTMEIQDVHGNGRVSVSVVKETALGGQLGGKLGEGVENADDLGLDRQ